MKLTDIISISGKPGLYELINKTKSPFTAKDLDTNRKLAIFPRDNIVSLADISIYTEDDDMPLGEVFEKIKEKHPKGIEDSKAIISSSESLHQFMSDTLPIYDKERVRDNDIKKLIKWYNILIKAGMESFLTREEITEDNKEVSDNK